MRRCPTCRADSPKLIHFGIYLCPTCGTVDADGNKVQPPPGVLLTPASAAVHESLVDAAPTPVADDTQPNNLAPPPPIPTHAMGPPVMGAPFMGPPVMGPPVMGPPVMGPMARATPAPPGPVPLDRAPPRPTPAPPRPVPLEAAPLHPRISSPDLLTVAPVEVSRTSFAAPPPRDPRDLIDEGTGPPQVLVWMIASYFVFEVAGFAFSSWPGCCTIAWMIPRTGFLMALLSGRTWARTSSIVGSALGIALFSFAMIQPLPNVTRAVVGLGIVFEVAWLYVLMRPEVVNYFAQKRA